MTKVKIAFFWAFLLVTSAFAQNTSESFDIRMGINLSEWLEKNENLDEKDSYVTLSVIDSLKKFGFDHVRIPINEEVLFDESLNVRQNFFDLLKSRVDRCQKNGLKVIIDLHSSRLFSFTKRDNPLFKVPQPIESFLNTWAKLQALFRDYPADFLAYECLNEPAAATDKHHLWNKVIAEWVSFIRVTEKKRFLFVGTNRGNQLWALKYLKIPHDNRLVLTVHYYTPFVFTHYAYSEAKAQNFNAKVHYPGKTIDDNDYNNLTELQKKQYAPYREYYDKKKIREDFAELVKFSKKHDIPVNIGEFGCRRFSDPNDRLQWFKDVTGVFKENRFSYTLWGLNGAGFGIWINGKLDNPMIDAIR